MDAKGRIILALDDVIFFLKCFFIIGRPITNPTAEIGSQKRAAELVIEEIERGLKEKDIVAG